MDRLIKVIGKHDIACTYTCAYESVIGDGYRFLHYGT